MPSNQANTETHVMRIAVLVLIRRQIKNLFLILVLYSRRIVASLWTEKQDAYLPNPKRTPRDATRENAWSCVTSLRNGGVN